MSKNFLRRDEGVTALEYALVAAAIFLVIIGAAELILTQTQILYENISTAL